jgi:hypothetical protein
MFGKIIGALHSHSLSSPAHAVSKDVKRLSYIAYSAIVQSKPASPTVRVA